MQNSTSNKRKNADRRFAKNQQAAAPADAAERPERVPAA